MNITRRISTLFWSMIAIAVVVAVTLTLGITALADRHDTATLNGILDKVPIPAGATLVSKNANPSGKWNESSASRQYNLPDQPYHSNIGATIIQALKDAGYQAVDPTTHKPDASLWQKSLEGNLFHNVTVVSSEYPKAFIEISWPADETYNLYLRGGTLFWTGK